MTKSMSKRQVAALETRQHILAAAKILYAEEAGIEVPISQLARKAGVAEGTVFSHFPDKASLLAAALIDEIENTLEKAWAELPTQSPCSEQIVHLAQYLYALYGTRPHMFRVFLKESLFLQGEWGTRVTKHALQFISHLSELIDKAKIQGKYKQDIDSNVSARNYFSLYFMELIAGLNEEIFNQQSVVNTLRNGILQMETGLIMGTGNSHD